MLRGEAFTSEWGKNVSDKVALITGITGQDGAHLARLLLAKEYVVHDIKRGSSLFNTAHQAALSGMLSCAPGWRLPERLFR